MLDWYRDGVDVQARLPLLSTYLGHADPKSTYWYLTITSPDFMDAYTDITSKTQSLLPEVGFE